MSFSLFRNSVGAIVLAVTALGCSQGNERLEEKARIEGKAQAQADLQAQYDGLEKRVAIAKAEGYATALAELQAQMENLDLLIRKARAEGKAQAEAELQTQMDNIEILLKKARAEARAQAEEEINAGNANLAGKALLMESDLATRHLFYQALKGTYEGDLSTERSKFKVRVTLVPSLPPATYARTRQLEEIAADLSNLYFHAQIVQWNPANKLSAVGCRVENIRPDINKGEIAIASSNCPNLYKLRVVDSEAARSVTDEASPAPSAASVSSATAKAIREGRIGELEEIRGEVHPSTNASIYTLSVKRSQVRE